MTKNKKTFSISETAETLIPDRLGRSSYGFAILLIVLMYTAISLLMVRLPKVVPLYFTLPWGEARLVPKMMLLGVPSMALILLILNLFLGRFSAKLSPLLPRVLAVASLVLAAMMMISLIGVIQSLIL